MCADHWVLNVDCHLNIDTRYTSQTRGLPRPTSLQAWTLAARQGRSPSCDAVMLYTFRIWRTFVSRQAICTSWHQAIRCRYLDAVRGVHRSSIRNNKSDHGSTGHPERFATRTALWALLKPNKTRRWGTPVVRDRCKRRRCWRCGAECISTH